MYKRSITRHRRGESHQGTTRPDDSEAVEGAGDWDEEKLKPENGRARLGGGAAVSGEGAGRIVGKGAGSARRSLAMAASADSGAGAGAGAAAPDFRVGALLGGLFFQRLIGAWTPTTVRSLSARMALASSPSGSLNAKETEEVEAGP